MTSRTTQNIVELNLAGDSTTSVRVDGMVQPGESFNLYVAEVDKNGKPVADAEEFGYRVTVSGDGIASPANFKVYFGTNQRELVEAAGGLVEGTEKVISGGPMMGFAMYSLDVPVTKTTSAIVCLKKDAVSAMEPTPCINCGRCVEVCPSRLIPSRLARISERGDEEGFIKMNGLECMECGSCSYVCPAKRQLKQAIGSMRKTALANRRKK